MWTVEAEALRLFKVLMLLLKICLYIQALKNCSLSLGLSPVSVHPSLSFLLPLHDLPVQRSELACRQCVLPENFNEKHKRFLPVCFAFGLPACLSVSKVNRVTDHFDFAGLDSQSGPTLNGEELFTRSLHKVANIQDVEKTK